MANEIQIIHDDVAETIYAIVRNMAGQFLAAATAEAFESANWATYDIALAQVDVTSPPASGNAALQGTFPALAAGFYWLDIYIQAGGSPAQTDAHLRSVLYYWDETSLVPAEDWIGRMMRSAVAVMAGNTTFNETTGVASFKDVDDGTTERATYTVSPVAVGRSEARIS